MNATSLQLISASHPINLKGKYTFFVDITLDRRRNEYTCTFPAEGLVILQTEGSSKQGAIDIMVQKLARDPVGWIKKGNASINKLAEMTNASQQDEQEAPNEEEAPVVQVYTEDRDPGDEHVEEGLAL